MFKFCTATRHFGVLLGVLTWALSYPALADSEYVDGTAYVMINNVCDDGFEDYKYHCRGEIEWVNEYGEARLIPLGFASCGNSPAVVEAETNSRIEKHYRGARITREVTCKLNEFRTAIKKRKPPVPATQIIYGSPSSGESTR